MYVYVARTHDGLSYGKFGDLVTLCGQTDRQTPINTLLLQVSSPWVIIYTTVNLQRSITDTDRNIPHATFTYTCNSGRCVLDGKESSEEEKLHKMQLKVSISSNCRMSDERCQVIDTPSATRFLFLQPTYNMSPSAIFFFLYMWLRPIVGQPGNSSIISRVKLGQTTIQLRKRAGFNDVGHRLGLTTGAQISVCNRVEKSWFKFF